MKKNKAILAVSFGTSYPDARENAIGGIEKALEKAFPDHEVRRCFTSGMVIRHIEKEEGLVFDGPEEALERAVSDGVSELLVQPTHLMNGLEYQKFMHVLDKYNRCFKKVKTGKPLLSDPEDYTGIISALDQNCPEKTAVILAGHGSESEADRVYAKLQECLRSSGREHYYVGTIESHPTALEILESIKDKDYQKLILLPFMVVAGDHAANDIAGNWKRTFEDAGYETVTIMKGLGEYPAIQDVYVKHLMRA